MYLALISLAFLSLTACGSKKGGGGKSGDNRTEIEKQFDLTASENQIPKRLLMAVGFLESNLSPEKASVPYSQVGSPEPRKKIGFTLTETAFGLTHSELGLPNDESAEDLQVQIEHYGRWLKEKLEGSTVELKPNASTVEEQFRWIWEMAKLHRNGEEQRRNVRVLWALDMFKVLNEGRVWQDTKTGTLLELKPASPQFTEAALPSDGRALLRITDDIADISNARRFELTSENTSHVRNHPRQIKVIHCPLSLSACLELQDDSIESDVKLGAHYVIPQDSTTVTRALQIVDHERRVEMTAADGTTKDVKDAIVIMLVGNSGRYIDGVRYNADPTWFTPWQLRRLSAVVSGVCRYLSERDSKVKYRECVTPENANGVHFTEQGGRRTYRWGDIPDYDKSIFWAYLRSSDSNIQGEALFEFNKRNKSYTAGEEIQFHARFPPGVTWIRLQRAVRCQDQQLVWDTLRTDPIRTKSGWPFKVPIWDSGPNLDGHHFLRVLVYGERNELTGWAIDDVYVRKFDVDFNPPSEACFDRMGS